MEQPVRLALIGCGGWMRYAHLPVLQKIENLEVVAGCDPSREALEQTAAAWGKPFEFFSSHKKMIKQTTPDAVLIVSPHDRHVSQTRFALEQGVHALVENPSRSGVATHARSWPWPKRKSASCTCRINGTTARSTYTRVT
jgi:predicted dehydrogenase